MEFNDIERTNTMEAMETTTTTGEIETTTTNKDTMTTCANLILTSAIDNFAYDNNIPLREARMKILRSRACETLYNFDSRLWCEGPDYFTAFYEAVERNDAKKNDARIGENLGRMGQ